MSAQSAVIRPAMADAGRGGIARRSWLREPMLLLLPSLALLFVFLLLPLVIIFVASLQPNSIVTFDGASLKNYLYIFSHQYYLVVIGRTMADAGITTLLCLPLGYLAAMILTGLSGGGANFAMMALTFPILAGPLVVILGWMALLTDGGPLFGPLLAAHLISRPRLMGTDTAVIISMVHFALPFVILTLYTSLRQIPAQLHEAATNLGAGIFSRFRHVTLPLSLPGILSSSVICFSLSASSYVSPYYIGGAAKLTLTTLISQFVLATYNSQMASAVAILLLLIMLAIIALLSIFLGRLIR